VSIHNETGLTVEPGDAEGLSDAMNWMVEHPKERIAMGKKARQRIKDEYQMSTMLERVMGLYEQLTNGRK
jgi:glycosyltransferase involved in cell wall biosynthesis